jgi:hypothetical protein
MYVVGAERLGTALDVVFASFANLAPVSPSVLRCAIVTKAEALRSGNPNPFKVTASCLLLVGGADDDDDCSNLDGGGRCWLSCVLPLGRMNKRLTADLPGRQGPCSSCVAAIGVFGQLFVGHATCWSGHHAAWRCDRVRP